MRSRFVQTRGNDWGSAGLDCGSMVAPPPPAPSPLPHEVASWACIWVVVRVWQLADRGGMWALPGLGPAPPAAPPASPPSLKCIKGVGRTPQSGVQPQISEPELVASGRWRLGRTFHHQGKQRESRKQQRQQEEHVGEGHDDPLPVHNRIELLQRHGLRVATVGRIPGAAGKRRQRRAAVRVPSAGKSTPLVRGE
jgi:hypothetical protein